MLALPAHSSPSIWVYNHTTEQFKVDDNVSEVRPIASITKLMTALVVLDHFPTLTKKQEQLLTSMLVRSDNHAAEQLAQQYPQGRSAFVTLMNMKADLMGWHSMKFVEPSGLSVFNIGTAKDVAALIHTASRYPEIRQITGTPTYKQLVNTNHTLLSKYEDITASKTGFTNKAGWCVAVVVEKNDQVYTVVVLGEPSKQKRISVADKLIASL